MNHAEICPVCKGSGKYKQYGEGLSTISYYETTCHGCNGKGWVIVPEIKQSYITGGQL